MDRLITSPLYFEDFWGRSNVLVTCKWNEPASHCLLSVKPLIGFEENDFNLVTKTKVLHTTDFELPPFRDSASSIEVNCAKTFLYLGKISPKTRELLCQQRCTELCVRSRLQTCWKHAIFRARLGLRTDTENDTRNCIIPSNVISTTSISKNFFSAVWWQRIDEWIKVGLSLAFAAIFSSRYFFFDSMSEIIPKLVEDFRERLQKKTSEKKKTDHEFVYFPLYLP